jgi:hypothetical protein
MEENDLIRANYPHVERLAAAKARALDKNEKAATFIGWSPIDPCIGGMLSYDGHCIHGNYGTCDQFQMAPDMRIPNNYLAALLTLPKFAIEKRESQVFSVYIEHNTPLALYSENIADAVIELLAMIYDKDKKNGR